MLNNFRFEDLNVYQEALQFNNSIYILTRTFLKDDLFGLTNQLRRAAVSITLNIAEGSSRTKKDFKHFLDLSKGSCFECVAVLTIAKQQNYINPEAYNKLYDQCNKLARMISKLQSSLQVTNNQ